MKQTKKSLALPKRTKLVTPLLIGSPHSATSVTSTSTTHKFFQITNENRNLKAQIDQLKNVIVSMCVIGQPSQI